VEFFCGSDALIWTKSRAFGAGFGTGTVCAEDGAAIQAAINNVNPMRMASANCVAIPNGGFLFNAKILSGLSAFYLGFDQMSIVFP
jgi:hypothetical protein